eukprot:TRINITY_DN13364_c0_g1_i1.p1 TRINITY_DN13364_c0_g1~~TRINITY_DN13364_c0_g1_i1.p1  ORF type:complete len:216 (-),score=25.80 TRINITY_DN13364_c0_g1_i1:69-638(-)
MTGSHQLDIRDLKDAIPTGSRWADIEVEALPEEGSHAGRRQLGPRGGRRPKFPAEAGKVKSVPEHVQAPVKQEPVPPSAAARVPAKPAASSIADASASAAARDSQSGASWSGNAGYWGDTWGGQGSYSNSGAWEPPSRADMASSWRRGENETVPSEQSAAYDGGHWGGWYGGRDWGQSRGGKGKSRQWY